MSKIGSSRLLRAERAVAEQTANAARASGRVGAAQAALHELDAQIGEAAWVAQGRGLAAPIAVEKLQALREDARRLSARRPAALDDVSRATQQALLARDELTRARRVWRGQHIRLDALRRQLTTESLAQAQRNDDADADERAASTHSRLTIGLRDRS